MSWISAELDIGPFHLGDLALGDLDIGCLGNWVTWVVIPIEPVNHLKRGEFPTE